MNPLREPLLHFVALGAVLFLIYAVASDTFSSGAPRRIEIGEAEIAFIATNWKRQWGRSPTEEELLGLVESRVREEVLYREALAVGLDQNDLVVRRRMVQKMELLSQDLALLADPTDDQLRSFFEERKENYRVPPRITFSHVFFSTDRRGAAAEGEARRVLAEIRAENPPPRRASERGDPFMLQHDYPLRTPLDVQQLFGSGFAEALFELEPGWHGPMASGYGIHLVHVGERLESRIPDYRDVRDRLLADYNRMRRERANKLLYESLVSGYQVEIDDQAVRRAALGGTVSEDRGDR